MYPALVETGGGWWLAGGGYVWGAVLEYRVWCHPEKGASDSSEGDDYDDDFMAFAEAFGYSQDTAGAKLLRPWCRRVNISQSLSPGIMFM